MTGGSPDREARAQRFMCNPQNPRNINLFVWIPDREDPSAPEEGQQQQLKTTSDVTSKFLWCCHASVLRSGKEALDVASSYFRTYLTHILEISPKPTFEVLFGYFIFSGVCPCGSRGTLQLQSVVLVCRSEAVTVNFEKTPQTQGGRKVQGRCGANVAGCLSRCPKS